MLNFSRLKTGVVLCVCLIGIILGIPNFISADSLPVWYPQSQVNLGLDLNGGSYLLLEGDTVDLATTRLEAMRDSVSAAMRNGTPHIEIGDISTRGGQLTFVVRDPSQVGLARQRLSTIIGTDVGLTGQSEWDVNVLDANRFSLKPTEAGLAQAVNTAMKDATEVVRRRIDELGTKEPTIVRQGATRIVVQVPGFKDPEALKKLVGTTAKLEFKLVDQTANPADLIKGIAPVGSQVLPYPNNPQGIPFVALKRSAVISGDQVADARQEFDAQTNAPNIEIAFNADGGRRFAKVTTDNVGKPFAIVLDNKVISVANINEPILGGRASITGNYTVQTANDLAIALRSGKLAVNLKIVAESTVSPDLGHDSVRAGVIASIVAAAAVGLFMLLTYGRFGFYANLAVGINIFIILAVMGLLKATLTLPGIAGFVLTIGTAVDANVLINERILEEWRRGRGVVQSVELGYKEASRTIFEANVTHAITGVIMLLLGSAPVKGFAVVLLIGICSSVFTAVTFTRMMVASWLRKRPRATTDIIKRSLKLVPDNTKLKFVSLRKWAFGLTLMLSLIAVGLVAFRGLNMGVDFAGGVLMEQTFKTAPSIEAVRSEVDNLGVGEASIQSFSDPKTLSIRLPLPSGGNEEATNRLVNKVSDDLAIKFPGATFSKYDTITGKVSDELITWGLLAVGLAIFGIALFAVVRFEWQFGVSTVVAIIHDLLMTAGFFALMRNYFEVNLNTVAAVLTIISYSINDKIVIDDRIRENMRKFRKMDMRQIVDLSVNETLPRTVMTSLTILLALFAMLILGGHVLRGFTAAMILGIVVGTYSSIYVSSSLLITLGLRADPKPRQGSSHGNAERISLKAEH